MAMEERVKWKGFERWYDLLNPLSGKHQQSSKMRILSL